MRLPKFGFIFPLSMSALISHSGPSFAACGNCVSLNDSVVTLQEVEIAEGSHYLARTTSGKTVELTPGGFRLAQIAVLLAFMFYFDSRSRTFSIYGR
jgi:hypothetical protein